MAVKIRLKRMGKMRQPYYRVVVVDGRKKRDGRVIEEIGKYHPVNNPTLIDIDSERAQYWLSVGAQPSDAVLKQLKITGDWQKFKGIDGAEGALKTDNRTAEDLEKAKQDAIENAANEAEKLRAAASEAKAKAEAEAAAAAEAEASEEAAPAEGASDAPAEEA